MLTENSRKDPICQIYCRHRPGNYQHSLHGLRSLRAGDQPGAKRTRSDLSTTRLGGTRSPGNLGTHPGGGACRSGQIGAQPGDVAAVGITNQRESAVVWDRRTGKPFYNVVVWQDTRTKICDRLAEGGQDRFRSQVGLPLATYFSGPKVQWILENVPGVRSALRGDALFGNLDTWVIWWLTGGPDNGSHVIDVTNASRTLLMNLKHWIGKKHSGNSWHSRCHVAQIVPSSDPNSWGSHLRQAHLERLFPFAVIWEISRQPWLGKLVLPRVKPRIPMARVVSCF